MSVGCARGLICGREGTCKNSSSVEQLRSWPTNVKFIASGARLRGEEDGGALLVRGMGARRPSRDRVTPRGRRSRARVPPRRQRTRRPGERAAPGPVRTIERSGGRAHGGPGDARPGAATGFDGRAAGQRRRPRIRVQRRRHDGQGGPAVEPVPHRRQRRTHRTTSAWDRQRAKRDTAVRRRPGGGHVHRVRRVKAVTPRWGRRGRRRRHSCVGTLGTLRLDGHIRQDDEVHHEKRPGNFTRRRRGSITNNTHGGTRHVRDRLERRGCRRGCPPKHSCAG